jgi:FlgN protein
MMAWLALVQDEPLAPDAATQISGVDRNALIADGCRRLARALDAERRAIDDLRQALRRQRAAVAADDAAALEQSADHVARAVNTLGEARRMRGEIMQGLTGSGDATLPQLERTIGQPLPPVLQDARAAVTTAARAAASDVAINQHVLRRALHAGDLFLQRLFSSMSDPMPVYAPGPSGPARETRSLLINRRA